jgi:tryptophan synthase alpha subunit
VKNKSPIPIAVGFGIWSSKDLKLIAKQAEIGIIGSAIVNIIKKHKNSKVLSMIGKFMSKLIK